MIRALFLSIGDLADRRILGILARSLAITLLIFVALAFLSGWALDGVDPCDWLGDGNCPLGPTASGLGAILLLIFGIWFLFPAIALGVISAYMDQIAAAVEARHYPAALANARPLGIWGCMVLGLKSSARLIVYNLIALPFYLLLLFTGIGAILLFVAVNGVALGRDLGEMVASRHDDRAARIAWLAATRGERAMMGMIVTAIFLVPFLNLLAPVIGASMATHLYHGSIRKA